jgi:hypothetical protein
MLNSSPHEPRDVGIPWWHLLLWCMLGILAWLVLLGLAALLMWEGEGGSHEDLHDLSPGDPWPIVGRHGD